MKKFNLSMAAGVILILIGLASMYISYPKIVYGALVFFAGILVIGLAFNLFTKYTPVKARRKRRR